MNIALTVTTCNADAAGFLDGVTFGVVVVILLIAYLTRKNFQKKDTNK